MVIESKRLILRDIKFSDYEMLFKNYWSDEKTTKFLLWKKLDSLQEAKFKMEKMINSLEVSDEYIFVICLKESGEQIGIASLKLKSKDVVEDIIIGMGSAFTGNGYGSEIVNKLLSFCFEKLKVKNVYSSCMDCNLASLKLHKKSGFTFVKISDDKYRKVDNFKYKEMKFKISFKDWKLLNIKIK